MASTLLKVLVAGAAAVGTVVGIKKGGGAATDDARSVSIDFPSKLAAGARATVKVRVRNSGKTAWQFPDVKLGAVDDHTGQAALFLAQAGGDPTRVLLDQGETVAPGATREFAFEVVAPAKAGTYKPTFRMVREGVRWFGDKLGKKVTVTGATTTPPGRPKPPTTPPRPVEDAARIAGTTIPKVMAPGKTSRWAVEVENTGTATWDDSYRLGTVDDNNGAAVQFTGDGRVYMPKGTTVKPGEKYTFVFPVKSPAQTGSYLVKLRMVHELVRWFGDEAGGVMKVDVPPPPSIQDDAAVVDVKIPNLLKQGEPSTFEVEVENTGAATWDDLFRLGVVGDGSGDAARFIETTGAEANRVHLPAGKTVKTGERHRFSFRVQAPKSEKAYAVRFQMVHEGVTWFGALATQSVVVQGTYSSPKRTGLVRLEGTSVKDDGGKFNALGATMFWATWGFRHDKPRLERALELLSQNGFDYVRVLGVVGDPNDPKDYWAGRIADERDPEYANTIAGLTDLAYDVYGLRIEWTLTGGTPNTDMRRLCDTFLAMSRGREQKIMHFEIGNEAWQNGFEDAAGADKLRELSRYLKDRTDILVASSAPASEAPADLEAFYKNDCADFATIHFDRDTSKTEGHWRPVRQPWGWGDYAGLVKAVSNNEPIGAGSSVATETDPLKLVSAMVVSHVANVPMYVYHSRAGVRGDLEYKDMAGVTSFSTIKKLLPPDLSSWSRKNAHWADSPIKAYARNGGTLVPDAMWPDFGGNGTGAVRAYAGVKGNEFVQFPFGIKGTLTMEPRRNVELDVIDVLTGQVLEHKSVDAGVKFDLSGKEAVLLKGHYR